MKKTIFKTKAVERRDRLGERLYEEAAYRADVGRSSMTNFKTPGIRQETLELRNVYCGEQLVAKHCWIKLEDVQQEEWLRKFLGTPTRGRTRKISFKGVVYPYAEPLNCTGFKCWNPKYSIGDIAIMSMSPALA